MTIHLKPAAAIFDMDGVVTDTAAVHAQAWKKLFDAALERLSPESPPFDVVSDYQAHVDGRTREDGVRDFLASRSLQVSDDEVQSLASEKQSYFTEALEAEGVDTFEDTITLIKRLRARKIPIGLVTSSRNGTAVLDKAGITELFDVRIDGNDVLAEGIKGKPSGDPFRLAARRLGVAPTACAGFEDARSGVAACLDAGYGLIVGVDRSEEGDDVEDALRDAGADRVLRNIAELEITIGWSDKNEERPVDVFSVDGYSASHLSDRETLFGTANGYWGTRASLPGTTDDGTHYPGTYLAGLFNRVYTPDVDLESEHVPNIFDWTYLRIVDNDGQVILPNTDGVLDFRREIDLAKGVTVTYMRVRDASDRITLVTAHQFTSMYDRHVAGLKVTVTPEDWSGELTVVSAINPDVRNRNVADDRMLTNRHFDEPRCHHVDSHTVVTEAETTQSRVTVAVGTRTFVHAPGEPGNATACGGNLLDDSLMGHRFSFRVSQDNSVEIEKLAVAYTSRDNAISTPGAKAVWALKRLSSFNEIVTEHSASWADLWNAFDVDLGATRLEEMAMEVNIFHVLQSVALVDSDLDAGLPARGITGEGYRGHIFWDELYVYPLLSTRRPGLARALLHYRYRRLDRGRDIAAELGLDGALYAWQSGSTGREETPHKLYNNRNGQWMPDNSHNQRHVALQVAYDTWRLFEYTGDRCLLRDMGAEMILEVARAFSSMATKGSDGRFSISGVMGPDEFHDGYPDAPGKGLKDNAYTNVLASWVLHRATLVLDKLEDLDASAIKRRLGLTDEELKRFDEVSRGLKLHFHADGVLSQFDGYEDLEEFDWECYRAKYGNIGRLDLILAAEGDTPNRYKLSKQADTLMLFYLFTRQELAETLGHMGYALSEKDAQKTTEYYLARTSDGSTLSQFAHAWALAQYDLDRGYDLYREALEADLDNDKGSSTAEGIHTGVMAGTADMVMRCFAGMTVLGEVLYFDPRLPEAVDHVRFMVYFHGSPVSVSVDRNTVTLSVKEKFAAPVRVSVRGDERILSSGTTLTF